MDLGFTVTEEMAEKPDVVFKKDKQVKSDGTTHNGRIRPDIHSRLLDLAIKRSQAGLHGSMTVAITAVLTAFWSEWRAL